MGYTTEFNGFFDLEFKDKSKKEEVINLVNGLASTRRMKRDLSKIQDKLDKPYQEYGIEGEFYYNDDNDNFGQNKDDSILEYNFPPSTQPGLWLQWQIIDNNDETYSLEWDRNEKFYYYTEWLEYLIEKIFNPNDVQLSGSVEFRGEEWNDSGIINIDNNKATISGA